MSDTGPIRLATRGSDLARIQSGSVRDALERRRRQVELVTVETAGDRIRDELLHRLGTTGAFVRSLDERILDGEVDAAVHSLKDVPTESPDELVVAAVSERARAGDVLVTPEGTTLDALPQGATVGTSSLRRGAQLRRERPDLRIEPLRGNVDTRVEKLLAPGLQAELDRRRDGADAADGGADESGNGDSDEAERGDADETDEGDADEADAGDTDAAGAGDRATNDSDADQGDVHLDEPPAVREWIASLSAVERGALERAVETEYDAIVLAAAGLGRVGLLDDLEVHHLPRETFVPAPGQGALAVTAERDGDVVDVLRTAVDHRPTRIATTAERAVLAELGGGCVAPLGVHASLQGRHVHVTVQALSRDGEEVVEASRDLPAEDYATAARSFARDLADRGAGELIERAKRETDEPGAEADAAEAAGEKPESSGEGSVDG